METDFIGTSKYKIGDKFMENGTRGYAWWQIDEIVCIKLTKTDMIVILMNLTNQLKIISIN